MIFFYAYIIGALATATYTLWFFRKHSNVRTLSAVPEEMIGRVALLLGLLWIPAIVYMVGRTAYEGARVLLLGKKLDPELAAKMQEFEDEEKKR